MPKVVTIVNFKGGVGKTTVTVNLAASLSHYKGKKVLIIDMDPQSNSTSYLMNFVDKFNLISQKNIYTLVEEIINSSNNVNVQNYILRANEKIPKLDILPGFFKMLDFDKLCNQYSKISGKNYKNIIKNMLPLFKNYDYILIYTPPSIKIETVNAILASKYFLVPYTPEPMVHHGFDFLLNKIIKITSGLDTPLDQKCKFLGVIFTKVNKTIKKHAEWIDTCVNRMKMDHMLQLGINPNDKNHFTNQLYNLADYIKSSDELIPICIYPVSNMEIKTIDRLLMEEFLERIGDKNE